MASSRRPRRPRRTVCAAVAADLTHRATARYVDPAQSATPVSNAIRSRGAGTNDRGSTSLELVIVLPVVLLIFFGAVQAGLIHQARAVALAAAEEGARVASTETGSAGAGQSAAATFAARAGGSWLQNQTVTGNRSAARATVTVTGTALSVVPGFDGFSVDQSASMPVERITG